MCPTKPHLAVRLWLDPVQTGTNVILPARMREIDVRLGGCRSSPNPPTRLSGARQGPRDPAW